MSPFLSLQGGILPSLSPPSSGRRREPGIDTHKPTVSSSVPTPTIDREVGGGGGGEGGGGSGGSLHQPAFLADTTTLKPPSSASSIKLVAAADTSSALQGMSSVPLTNVLRQSSGASDREDSEDDQQNALGSETDESSSARRHHLSRVGSVYVSEWGVEHTLKLKEEEKMKDFAVKEEKEEEEEEEEEEEDNVGTELSDTAQLHDLEPTTTTIPEEPSSTNQHPSSEKASQDGKSTITAVPRETALTTQEPLSEKSGEGNWWSQAMAETHDIDDFDSLIETIDSSSTSRATSSSKTINDERYGLSSSPFSLSPSSIDIETDGHRQLSGGQRSKSPSPLSESSHNRRTSPSSSDTSDYIMQAGKLIAQGLQFEQDKDYKEALDLFKAGVDVLLNGVQSKCCIINCCATTVYAVNTFKGVLITFLYTCLCTLHDPFFFFSSRSFSFVAHGS